MLNRAHWLHRQAEKATRKGNVEEAVKYHKEAADILNQLLQNILDEKVAESIRLQAQLHEKENSILLHQRRKAEKVYRESVIRNMANHETTGQTSHLLDQLKLYDSGGFGENIGKAGRSFNAVPSDFYASNNQDVVVGVASKKPKDDKVIIEELQVANSHLRKMVDSLFHELSTCQRENLELKARIRQLESLQLQGGNVTATILSTAPAKTLLQSQSAQASPNLGMRTFKPQQSPQPPPKQAAPPMETHPPISESTSASSMAEECNLPPLPPLEMPTFNFDRKSDA